MSDPGPHGAGPVTLIGIEGLCGWPLDDPPPPPPPPTLRGGGGGHTRVVGGGGMEDGLIAATVALPTPPAAGSGFVPGLGLELLTCIERCPGKDSATRPRFGSQ